MSTSQKFSVNQNGFAPILIVVLVALTALGGYLIYQNRPKPTPPPQPTTQPSPTPAKETTYKTSNEMGPKYEKICQSKAYINWIYDCGEYAILTYTPTDVGTTIIDNDGNEIASCGGMIANPSRKSKCELYNLSDSDLATKCKKIGCK